MSTGPTARHRQEAGVFPLLCLAEGGGRHPRTGAGSEIRHGRWLHLRNGPNSANAGCADLRPLRGPRLARLLPEFRLSPSVWVSSAPLGTGRVMRSPLPLPKPDQRASQGAQSAPGQPCSIFTASDPPRDPHSAPPTPPDSVSLGHGWLSGESNLPRRGPVASSSS